MKISEFYEALGEDYNEVRQRLMSDRLVKKFVLKFSEDKTFDELSEALEKGNYADGFRAAHSLKGICLNLGFHRFFTVCSALTEYLRPSDGKIEKEELNRLFFAVKENHQRLISAISAIDKD